MNVFVLDIETIPDIEAGRKIYQLEGLSDAEVADAMFAARRQETGGSEFMPLHLHKVVCISIVLRSGSRLKVLSLGDENASEKEMLSRFYAGLERYSPTLVTWNGNAFDLPVLNYRSLVNGVAAQRYWETGEKDADFRWNNYINRYHNRHTDIMDILAGYQGRANAPLDHIATMLGFPGKMGMSGDLVWSEYCEGNIQKIRNYCETDVLNTYLVYLRFQVMRGQINDDYFIDECLKLRQMLVNSGKPHLVEFAEQWNTPVILQDEWKNSLGIN